MGEVKNIYFTCLKFYLQDKFDRKDATQEGRRKGGPPKKPKDGASGGKAKKKKWSKGKTRDKLNNLVPFDKATYDKLLKEVPTYKLITPSIVSERLKVRGSLARKALIQLEKQGKIREVVRHSSQMIYTRPHGADDEKDE